MRCRGFPELSRPRAFRIGMEVAVITRPCHLPRIARDTKSSGFYIPGSPRYMEIDMGRSGPSPKGGIHIPPGPRTGDMTRARGRLISQLSTRGDGPDTMTANRPPICGLGAGNRNHFMSSSRQLASASDLGRQHGIASLQDIVREIDRRYLYSSDTRSSHPPFSNHPRERPTLEGRIG
jgi:hypothetical protein